MTTIPLSWLFSQQAHINLSSNKIPFRLPISIFNIWLEERDRVNAAPTLLILILPVFKYDSHFGEFFNVE